MNDHPTQHEVEPKPQPSRGVVAASLAVTDDGYALRLVPRAPWRIGRKVGRTIYVQVGDHASDDDHLIGMMDTPELAQVVVNSVNQMWREEST